MTDQENQLLWDAGARYTKATLENYEIYDKEQKAVIDRLVRCDNWTRNVLFIGSVGTGKDHLMVSLMRQIAAKGNECRIVHFQTLMRNLRDNMTRKRAESELVRPLFAYPLLGISDPIPPLRSLSGYNVDVLFSIIDERYCKGRPTWVTMNADSEADAEKKLTSPVFDRLRHDAEVYLMKWPSYRGRK